MNLVPIHPVYTAFIEEAKKAPPIGSIPLPMVRQAMDKKFGALPVPDVLEEDRTVEWEGRTLKLTLMRPIGTENEILPVVIFYHGGGWVLCSKHTHGKLVRDIVIKSHVAVVFPDYALAPENQFPAAHEDAYATLKWVLANSESINVDISKLATCGDSAGGNLAAAIPLMARDRGVPSDAIKTQILIYPSTSGEDIARYKSYQEFGNGEYFITIDGARFFNKSYANEEGCASKYLCLMNATVQELQGLPPALVLLAEVDILRDEGEAYAQKLTLAGVETVAVRVLGVMHGYMGVHEETPMYRHSLAMIDFQLTQAFAGKL